MSVTTPSPYVQGLNVVPYSGSQGATGTLTIYTCPTGFKARVVYIHLAYSIGGGLGEIQVNSIPVMRLIAVGTVASSYTYETALVLYAGQTVGVRASVGGTSFGIVHIIEESI